MGGFRAERIAELIHGELARRLRVEVKDPRLEPISITAVKVSGDLQHARVRFVPLGGGEASEDLCEALDQASRTLRGPIGRALRLRRAPEIVFEVDRHFEDAVRLTRVLEGLSRDGEGIEE